MKYLFFVFISGILTLPAHAQQGAADVASVSVNVTATVQESIDLITLSNMVFGRVMPGQREIVIDPKTDAMAGAMKAIGRPNAGIRITYQERRELVRAGGTEVLVFFYEVTGNTEDNQFASEPIQPENRDMLFSPTGEYFFWIGGRVNIENVVMGQYDGEFTIEVEYI